ncbi:uridine diphosphate glucose pyrophosphatase isoform X2 [Camponotus floridanus]|uniref:uridine diphosphate glucose pyrophosphatase isoform X2 n=1 Tax=Camponotus floridanus TaxID=104421 RepID=UPI00059D0D54|nr:uridine diphosphate glucose pyrophosphatase isoform X2 [Camponotus floridanus]
MNVTAQEEKNQVVRRRMLDLHDVHVGKVPHDSPWLRSVRLRFLQDGQRKEWDVISIHDSEQKDVDVKRYPATLGLALELCAGIVDKDKPLVEIAREELREECGYEAPISAFEEITTYLSSASASAKQTLFYVEVTDDMHIHPGGGAESEGELIEVVELSIPELKDYMRSKEIQSPSSFLFGVTWFLFNKSEYCS